MGLRERLFALALPAAILMTLGLPAHAETATLKVKSAVAAKDEHTAIDVIDVTLAPESRRNLAAFTQNRVGKQIHLRAGDVRLTSVTVQSPIASSSLRLTAGVQGFGGKSADEIASRLNQGGTLSVSDEK